MINQKYKFKEKLCVITGANAGIGKETAIQLAAKGYHIIMICRNREKAEIAQNEIKEKSANERIDLLIADLASLKSVGNVAKAFKQKYEYLHVLINNAGIFNRKRMVTENGYESTFAVDYLAHFLLTNSLLDIIKKSAPSRIINVSSNIHLYFKINFDDLMSEKKYSSQKAYANAKFALVLFTYELARRLDGTGVTVNALHPGHAKTKMITPTKKSSKIFQHLISPLIKSPEEAARTSVYLASSPEVEGITGKYYKKCKPVKSHKLTYDESLQTKLWRISEKLVNI
ncbi:MAG: SDR family oxidoreductase [Candidatus Odinarchaeota archaeon]